MLNFDSLFPYRFDNGLTIGRPVLTCAFCLRKIQGAAETQRVSNLIPSVVDIWAEASCPCGMRNQFRMRLRDDGSYSYQKENKWHERIAPRPQKGLVVHLKAVWSLLIILFSCLKVLFWVRKMRRMLAKQNKRR